MSCTHPRLPWFLTTPLGGSWVAISGVISRVTIHIRGRITLLITTHEPPSTGLGWVGGWVDCVGGWVVGVGRQLGRVFG